MDETADQLATALDQHRAGRLDDAEAAYREILATSPRHADALHLLGMLAHARGAQGQAIGLIGRAILVEPGAAEFHSNIAAVYLSMGQSEEAIAHARRAVALCPFILKPTTISEIALFATGAVDEAIDCFDTARKLDPTNPQAQTNYLFAINFSARFDRARIARENIDWGDKTLAGIDDNPEFANDRRESGKLRIGYFLPEPGGHVTARFLEPVLRHHDRDDFEIVLYVDRGDAGNSVPRTADLADRLVDLTGFAAADQAAAIRRDRVDILNHTASFKARYRLILAHRAAPIQIASTNLVSTTGLGTVDYLVTDATIDPAGVNEGYYREKLLRLSNFNCYGAPEDCPDPAPLPALKNGVVTFGSFNNVAKISPETVAAWSKILRRVPGARLVLKHRPYDDANIRRRLIDVFAGHGIDESQIRFSGFTAAKSEYLASYDEIDIGLDPFPFSGGTTTYEALWMGIPVVALAGDSFMGGLAAGLMTKVGCDAFVAPTVERYIEAAVRSSQDLAALTRMRASLRRRATDSIFNASRLVSELEAAYRSVWREYCGDAGATAPAT